MRINKIPYIIVSVWMICFMIFINAEAAIVITGIDDDTPSEGQTISISVTGQEAHALDIEWLGGASGNIENGTIGNQFSKTNWSVLTPSTSQGEVKYSNTRTYSGTKSIECGYPLSSQFDAGFSFINPDVTFDSVYATWNVYFDHVDSKGQWKQWRIRPQDAANIYGDTFGEIMQSGASSFLADGSAENSYTIVFCDTTDPTDALQCFDPPIPGGFYNANKPQSDVWMKYEVYAEGSSADGVADGTILVKQTLEGNTTQTVKSQIGDVITRKTGTSKWGNFVFQNFWGNILAGTGTLEKIYYDGVYLQFNNWAHLEITNNATYASSTQKVVLLPTSWGATIQFVFDSGSFDAGSTVYLYVIDENGDPSNPETLTIAGGTNPNLSCQSNDTSSSSSYSSTGTTYTLEGARTVSSCTWSGSLSGSGTCTATGGNITASLTGLSEGANVITYTLTDSAAEEGSCNFTVTYTAPSGSGTVTIDPTATPVTIDPTATPVYRGG